MRGKRDGGIAGIMVGPDNCMLLQIVAGAANTYSINPILTKR